MAASRYAALMTLSPKMLALALLAGVGFNLSQRILDYVLDAIFKTTPYLAWLNN